MIEPNDPDQKLERLISRTLRAQPLRTAPQTLEARVLREIERRAAVQWSRLDFMRWPVVVRVAFVLLCIAMAKIMFDVTAWGTTQLVAALRFVPLDWVLGALVFSVVMYAALFSLGAVAYRTLRIER
jgi:hypothetical protein